jgi:hypothetical protein
VTIPKNVDAINSMILGEGGISAKKKDSRETGYIPKKSGLYYSRDLYMRKLSAIGFRKCLNAGQKRDQVLASLAILDRFRRDPVRFLTVL